MGMMMEKYVKRGEPAISAVQHMQPPHHVFYYRV